MRLAVSFSLLVGALPIRVMLLSVTATWIVAWLSVGSLLIALSISDFRAAGLEAEAAGVVAKLPLPVIDPELLWPMGTALSPLWLEGSVVELLDCEPVVVDELASACGAELVLGAVVPAIALELPVVEPVPVAPVCAPMEPFGLAPLLSGNEPEVALPLTSPDDGAV